MNSKRVFFGMVIVLVLLVGGSVAAVVTGTKLLKKQSEKLVSLKLDNVVLDQQQQALGQAKKDVEKYSDLEKIAKTIVPQEKDQARTVREIINLATTAQIPIASISFPASTLGLIQAPVSAAAGAATTPTTPAAPKTTITQVKPVDGITGVYELDIVVTSDSANPVPYARLINFLTLLEKSRRTAQVSSISVQPSPKDRNLVSFNLTVKAYIKP